MVASTTEEIERKVQAMLAPSGILTMGWFTDDNYNGLLLGNVGSSIWPTFAKSGEYADGEPDPMNRWTMSIIGPVAEELDAEVRYPFGDVLWSFQKYAQNALGIWSSPVGLLIHPKYGLWTAFRGALMFEGLDCDEKKQRAENPCETCAEKPCLNTCPVGVFSQERHDYDGCKSHVGSPSGSNCLNGGCLARLSCPVGPQYAYGSDHQAFHMKAFVG